MLPLRSDYETLPGQSENAPAEASNLLNFLRFTAFSCRVKPRTDLFKACALLHVNRSQSLESHAEALMRCLQEALGKSPKLHAPGTAEMSFDEAWLVQLGDAIARDNQASIAFLLRSRVLPEHRRLVGFLVGRISEFFHQV